jgi:transcription elongation GreA/GreB family factor
MHDKPDNKEEKEVGQAGAEKAGQETGGDVKPVDESRLTGLGSRIRVYDINGKKYMFVTLVEEKTITPETKGIKIAVESPLGMKLLGKKVGSVVEHNDLKFRIVNYTRDGRFFS